MRFQLSSRGLLPGPCGGDAAEATTHRPLRRNRWQAHRWQARQWQALGRLAAVVGLAWIDTLLIGSILSMVWLGFATAGLALVVIWIALPLTIATVAAVSGIGFGLVFLANLWPVAGGRLPDRSNLVISGWIVLAGIILMSAIFLAIDETRDSTGAALFACWIAPAAVGTGFIAVQCLTIRAKWWIEQRPPLPLPARPLPGSGAL